MSEEIFVNYLSKLNIDVTNTQLDQLEKFYCLLIEWNEKINLTGITKKEDVYLKHFYDSLTINSIVDLNTIQTLCDVGSGAGFPGIVLKIMFPKIKITLLDSLNKRTDFLRFVIKDLNLKDIEVITARAEEYNKRESFDLVTARAVAPLNILLEMLVPISKKEIVLMKGNCEQELLNTDHLYKELNISLEQKVEFLLPFEESKRTLLKYKKLDITSKKYPRRYDKIKKQPL